MQQNNLTYHIEGMILLENIMYELLFLVSRLHEYFHKYFEVFF